MGSSTPNYPTVVKRAIDHADKASFTTLDHVLLSVLNNKTLSETIESLEAGGGWEYVFYLYEYQAMQQSIKTAWDVHMESENKKRK